MNVGEVLCLFICVGKPIELAAKDGMKVKRNH
jgi:hypothetical protein